MIISYLKSFKERVFIGGQIYSYVSFSLLSTIFSFIKLLLFAKLLGADDFAQYSIFDLVAAYGLYLGTLGLLDGTARLVPLYLGSGKEEKADDVSTLAASGQLIISGVGLTVYLLVVYVLLTYFNVEGSFLFLSLAGVYAFCSNMLNMGLMFVISRGYHRDYGIYLFSKNVLSLFFGLALYFFFDLIGVIVADIMVISILAWRILNQKKFVKKFIFSRFIEIFTLAKSGILLMSNNLLQNLSRNTERIIIGASLGIFAFGQYSFAMVMFTIGIAVQNIVSQYLNPRLCHQYGMNTSLILNLKKIDRLMIIVCLAGLLFYPIFIFATDWLRVIYFQEYILGVDLIQILYFAALFQLGQVYQGFLIAKGKGKLLNFQAGVSVLLSLLLCVFGYIKGYHAVYYSWIFVINRFVGMVFLRSLANK